MTWFKKFLTFVFIVGVIYLLVLYWFFPFQSAEFSVVAGHSNFSLNSSSLIDMQFYENMRYPEPEISYRIHDCPLAKENEMQSALNILENETVLKFYHANFDEEISVACDSKSKIKEGMFIGGEGGPTNITKTDNFNVILGGSILLLRETKCERPNIALHELLHALGFAHSKNQNNVMYDVVKCYQTLGQDISDLINELYSYPTYSDLAFGNVSASMSGRFLDLNMTLRNHGLMKSEPAQIMIYTDDKLVKEVDLAPLAIGAGRMIILNNVLIYGLNFDELRIFIISSSRELDKENNKITLQIKK